MLLQRFATFVGGQGCEVVDARDYRGERKGSEASQVFSDVVTAQHARELLYRFRRLGREVMEKVNSPRDEPANDPADVRTDIAKDVEYPACLPFRVGDERCTRLGGSNRRVDLLVRVCRAALLDTLDVVLSEGMDEGGGDTARSCDRGSGLPLTHDVFDRCLRHEELGVE